MLLNTITPTKITANLRKRFDVASFSFLAKLRRKSLADLDAHVMIDEHGAPFVDPYASLELRANGTFSKGKFRLQEANRKYQSHIHERVYLFATEEANMAALRAEWFQQFAFQATTHRLEKFADENHGKAGRPMWALNEEELGRLTQADTDFEFFSSAISQDGIEQAMIETEVVLIAVEARNELTHQETASAHEKLARFAARRELGLDQSQQLLFAA